MKIMDKSHVQQELKTLYKFHHRQEIETSIISAVLFLPSAYQRVADYLVAKSFSVKLHQQIWQACAKLWPDQPIDLRTVMHEILKNEKHLIKLTFSRCKSAG